MLKTFQSERNKVLARWEAVAIGALVLAGYIVTRAGQHTYDGLMFASAIRLNVFLPSVFRPHNMLYLPTAIGISKLISVFTPFDGAAHAIFVGQLWSALWGAVSAILFFFLARRILQDWQSVLLTLFFCSAYAIWFVSTEVEVYTISLAATAGLYLSLFRRSPSLWIAGLLWGAAILGHLTNLLLIIPLFVYCILIQRRSWLRSFAVLVGVGYGTAFLMYAIVGLLAARVPSVLQFAQWVESYAMSQQLYGIFKIKQFTLGILGLKRAFVAGPAKALMSAHAAVLLFSTLLVLARRGITRRLGLILFCHIITYALFFSWWEPLNVEFWVVTLLPLCLLVGVGWRQAIRVGKQWLFAALLILALVIQLSFNIREIDQRMDPSRDIWMEKGRRIARVIDAHDLVITFNDPLVFTLPLAAGHVGAVSVDMLAGASEADFRLAKDRLAAIIEATRRNGGDIYVTREALAPDAVQLKRLSISRNEYLQALRSLVGSELNESVAEGLIYR